MPAKISSLNAIRTHDLCITEVMGSNPVQAWIFSDSFSQPLKLRSNCEDLSSAFQNICFIYLHSNLKSFVQVEGMEEL